MAEKYSRESIKDLAFALLTKGGLPDDKAEVVAELLTRTDELGVTTHGLSMVPYYLPELASGKMTTSGTHEVVSDRGATMVWDGNYLPGHWLMTQALDLCIERARIHGVACLAMRRSHHIGCLSTLTRIAAEAGFVCMINTSDPSGTWVAPFGGTTPVLTPNPWAVGYPAADHPVLIDTCASITTVSKVREYVNSKRQFDHPWMLDGAGNPTTDPNVVNQTPKGSILPVGGSDHGHKGFAMALTVEMLSQALSGHGRSESVTRWGGNVFLQVMDPEAFAGLDAFTTEVDALNTACRSNPPAPGVRHVRIPGDRAAEMLTRSRTEGISLPDEVWTRVTEAAGVLGVRLPRPISG